MPERRLRWSEYELYTDAAILAMVWLKIYQSQGLIDLHSKRPEWSFVFIALIVASSLSVAAVNQQAMLEDMAREADKREAARSRDGIQEGTQQFKVHKENAQILEDIPAEFIQAFATQWEELMGIAEEYYEAGMSGDVGQMNDLEAKYLTFKQQLFEDLDTLVRQNPSLAFGYIHPTSQLNVTRYTSVGHDLKRLSVLRERLVEVLVTAEEITRNEVNEDREHKQRLERLQAARVEQKPTIVTPEAQALRNKK